MRKPFQKAPGPLSFAEGPRLTRSLGVLDDVGRRRFAAGYRQHVVKPYYATIRRRGSLIELTVAGTDEVEVYDFGREGDARLFLSALTDCFRLEFAPLKVLVPIPPPV